MGRKKMRPLISLDADDVLFRCNDYAVELANKKYDYDRRLVSERSSSGGAMDQGLISYMSFTKMRNFAEISLLWMGPGNSY